MQIKNCIIGLFLISLFFSGCGSRKKIVLFQDAKVSNTSDTSNTSKDSLHLKTLRIQPFDVIDIRVISSEKALGNLTESRAIAPAGSSVGGYFTAYHIDERGMIDLPLIGEISLLNLTLQQAKDLLQDSLKEYLKNPFVDIKFLTFKITMLGEVLRPGVVTVPNEKANLIDALALAGDMTQFGDRTAVKIIRGDPSAPTIYEIDLTTVKSFSANGFLLMPNDIVYVQPLQRKFTINSPTTALTITILLSTLNVLINFMRL